MSKKNLNIYMILLIPMNIFFICSTINNIFNINTLYEKVNKINNDLTVTTEIEEVQTYETFNGSLLTVKQYSMGPTITLTQAFDLLLNKLNLKLNVTSEQIKFIETENCKTCNEN